jgi:hypothetical protein
MNKNSTQDNVNFNLDNKTAPQKTQEIKKVEATNKSQAKKYAGGGGLHQASDGGTQNC